VYSSSSEAVAVVATTMIPPSRKSSREEQVVVDSQDDGMPEAGVAGHHLSTSVANPSRNQDLAAIPPVLSHQVSSASLARSKLKPTLRNLRPSTAPSQHPSPSLPRTPPPFSDAFTLPPLPARISSAPEIYGRASDVNAGPEFHVRQRRAAKLSKFFGVGMNDIAGVLPSLPPIPNSASQVEIPPVPNHLTNAPQAISAPARSKSYTTVEISTEVPRRQLRFLGAGQQSNVKELDMYDAIDQLRRMRV